MSGKPVFVATHPRACSTAFERVFMTRRDTLQCAHEPFGDSFYYGPERLSERYAKDDGARESSGFSQTTYQDVLDRLRQDGSEGKRVFIKDMAYYLMPPDGKQPALAPSLIMGKFNGSINGEKPLNEDSHVNGVDGANGVNNHANGINGTNGVNGTNGTNGINGHKRKGSDGTGNPTVVPLDILKQFHWTFLIRHPRRGIPSYYRCCIPPLSEVTGFSHFMPNEAGYLELRRLFDYLREQKIVGPSMAGETNETKEKDDITITVIDADDLLDHPEPVIHAFCRETGIPFTPDMLNWDDEENQKYVSDSFAKWIGFHNDAINSKCLSARTQAHKAVTDESENEEWRQKYGEEGQKIIRACVDENIPHYEYLKSFALKF
ncbi:P-loop containing nucleoside triphosphate hydrolase protein [Biscogniauxia mediterranea]|nr:P-loop containing nucleoside triphosphate hydrolase protein [Biscogniauxia mediterranea]